MEMNTENQHLADSNYTSIHISDMYNSKILNINRENNVFAFSSSSSKKNLYSA